MGSVLRAAALRGLPELVADLGGDAAELFARATVPLGALDNDEALIDGRAAARLLSAVAADLACPDLGLRLSTRQDIGVLGPLSIAVQNSATFGDGLDIAVRFLFAHSSGSSVAQVPDAEAGVTALRYANREIDPLPPQVVDYALSLFHRVLVRLSGGSYGLRSVHLPHPPLTSVDVYTDHFGAQVRFAQPSALLRVPTPLLGTSVPGADPVLREVAMGYVGDRFTEPRRTTSGQVRTVLARSLGSAPLDLDAVARRLTVNPRTLQRRLAAESTTFDALLDEARRDVAQRLLTETDLPLSQVSQMVGSRRSRR
ncbi:AraC family transcriptional regulator ligand-binding domain-containing protein [Pseudonocardia nematodicida]